MLYFKKPIYLILIKNVYLSFLSINLAFRAKYHKIKYGTELNQGDMSAPIFDEPGAATEITVDSEAPFTSVSNITWKQGRSLLRQYVVYYFKFYCIYVFFKFVLQFNKK